MQDNSQKKGVQENGMRKTLFNILKSEQLANGAFTACSQYSQNTLYNKHVWSRDILYISRFFKVKALEGKIIDYNALQIYKKALNSLFTILNNEETLQNKK